MVRSKGQGPEIKDVPTVRRVGVYTGVAWLEARRGVSRRDKFTPGSRACRPTVHKFTLMLLEVIVSGAEEFFEKHTVTRQRQREKNLCEPPTKQTLTIGCNLGAMPLQRRGWEHRSPNANQFAPVAPLKPQKYTVASIDSASSERIRLRGSFDL
ncbi:hypothetical protein Bbelb_190860 [Branchiostoma belcheri]|nr:hypothetical protein Bbelb_190860 [Branchiostoma belcheri]